MLRMPGRSFSGPLPALTEEEREVRARLERHVRVLAGEIGERNLWRARALQAAAGYVERVLRDLGAPVAWQEFRVREIAARNLEIELRGQRAPEEIVLAGAHYDSVYGSPGANDNATGTAAVLELARLLKPLALPRTVRAVAFVNEEPPFFQTEEMGSRLYARRSRARGEKIVAMLSLETMGYYSDVAGSQRYPLPFALFYPSTADFIGFVGNLRSRDLVRRTIGVFRRHVAFPSEGVAAPGWIIGIGWSDHWSFWKEGYSAVMVTDTALFRYPHYHTAEDTPDKIDYDRLARVVVGLGKMLAELAGG